MIDQNLMQEKPLFDKTLSAIRADEARYVYLRVSSSSQEICIWWEVKGKKYITKNIYLYASSAIYRFDLAVLRASDSSGEMNYYWDGEITNFGIKHAEACEIKWFRFANAKLSFQEDCELIEMVDYPEVLHFEVTRNCNLNCYMCRENRAEEVRKIGLPDLAYSLFEKTIPFTQHVNNVALFGWGEPLVHPQFSQFIDAVGRIKARNHPSLIKRPKPYVNFTSNATLLHQDLISRLIDQELNEVVISLDSVDPSNYNFIRKNADFNHVMVNLQNLKKMKKERGVNYPVLTIAIVAMRRNIEEMPEIIKFAADMGATRVLVNYLTVVTKGLEQESLFYHQDLANRMFDLTEKASQVSGVPVTLPTRFGSPVVIKGYCDDVQEMFYIRAEGTVIGCCIGTDYIIGDLRYETPEDIWQGDRRKELIGNLKRGILNGQCNGCYKFTGTDINLKQTHIKV